jgi:hypothetical protein
MVAGSLAGCKPNHALLGDEFPNHLSAELGELLVPARVIVGELVVIEP